MSCPWKFVFGDYGVLQQVRYNDEVVPNVVSFDISVRTDSISRAEIMIESEYNRHLVSGNNIAAEIEVGKVSLANKQDFLTLIRIFLESGIITEDDVIAMMGAARLLK